MERWICRDIDVIMLKLLPVYFPTGVLLCSPLGFGARGQLRSSHTVVNLNERNPTMTSFQVIFDFHSQLVRTLTKNPPDQTLTISSRHRDPHRNEVCNQCRHPITNHKPSSHWSTVSPLGMSPCGALLQRDISSDKAVEEQQESAHHKSLSGVH